MRSSFCGEQRRLAGAASADAFLAAQEAHAQAHAPALQAGTALLRAGWVWRTWRESTHAAAHAGQQQSSVDDQPSEEVAQEANAHAELPVACITLCDTLGLHHSWGPHLLAAVHLDRHIARGVPRPVDEHLLAVQVARGPLVGPGVDVRVYYLQLLAVAHGRHAEAQVAGNGAGRVPAEAGQVCEYLRIVRICAVQLELGLQAVCRLPLGLALALPALFSETTQQASN